MINLKLRSKNLIKRAGTRNLEEIAIFLNIRIKKYPFKSQRTKGYFKKVLGKKFIVINSNLDEKFQRVVLAHEIGHAVLHASNVDSYWHEYTNCVRNKFEIDADKFASELLIDDTDIDTIALDGMSINQLATYYSVPEHMIKYKLDKKELLKP